MKDLGDYHACWAAVNTSSSDYDTGVNGILGTSAYTSGGSMQFYPNPVGSDYYSDQLVGNATEPAGGIPHFLNHQDEYKFNVTNQDGGQWPGVVPRNYFLEGATFSAAPYSVSSTAGGNCVRAHGGSQINVLNVNFPAGWWNASGMIYDVSGGEKAFNAANLCNRTFIWNISDTSRLHAAFCSVSGMDPRTAAYNGPSSIYAQAGETTYYGAPSSTPHTSSLSVLDFYGLSPGGESLPVASWPIAQSSSLIAAIPQPTDDGFMNLQLSSPSHYVQYGTSGGSLQNRGPFRLYVSVDPMVNYFSSMETSGFPAGVTIHADDGFARQLYAQGYNLSGDVSAGPTTLSATYGNALLDLSKYGTAAAAAASSLSGFVFNNQVVDPTTYTRILLDESAAHTFANAKNGAMGTSNRSKICTIYISRTTKNAEGDAVLKSFGRGYTSPDVFNIEREE